MSNSSSNRINVPEARQALSNMKYEIANEMGINLTKGYNGNLSAKENGSIGGMMAVSYTHLTLPTILRV